jgi:uncharacterized protein (TIGR02001 family)
MKKSFFLFSLILMPLAAYNQDSLSRFDVSADIVSRYIWRGMALSSSPAFQPGISCTLGNFEIGSWASYTFATEPLQEVDLYLAYSVSNLTASVYDYYNPFEIDTTENYFDWNGKTTRHMLEGSIAWSGIGDLPFTFLLATIFYGNDRDEEDNNNYSTYFEASYAFELKEGKEFNVFAGITPFSGMYAEKFALVNLGCSLMKEIKITDNFSVPLTGSLVINPDARKVYAVFGITF